MSIEILSHNKVTWINIERPTHDDLEYLRRHYPFHPLDLEDCLSRIERPKVDEYDDYLFIVMHFPVFNKARRVSTPSEVDLFIGANYLITVHEGTLKPVYQLFDTCQKNEEVRCQHMGKGAGRLLYSLLDRLVDYILPILNKVGGQIRALEEDMFTEDMRRIVEEISFLRRDVIALRRVIKPQIGVVANLERQDRPFIQDELDVYFGDIADGFARAWDILEDYREVVEGLSETSDSVISYRINEVMRILTVLSVIMLPLTLLSGIYGMNITLPLARHPLSFALIAGMMIVIAGGMLAYFRHRRWV